MRRSLAAVLALALVLTARSGAYQDANPLKSGPQDGEALPGAFHFLNVTGGHAGNPHCLVCEYQLEPVALVFAREVPDKGKPLANLLQKLDEAADRQQKARLHTFAALLTDDVAKEETRVELVKNLEGLATSLDLKQLVFCVGPAAGPAKYNLNKDAQVTVLLYHKMKVVANFAYGKDKLTDKDVTAVLAAVEKLVAAKK